MYNSQYYTCEEIDQRLLQGYLDDYNTENNTSLTKAQFLSKLGSILSVWHGVDDEPTDGSEKLAKSGGITKVYGKYAENHEFVYVKTDSEGKILWAIKTDGGIYYGAGVPQQVIDYIEEKLAKLLDEHEDIVTFLSNLEKDDKTLQDLLDEKVDKVEGKSLIDAEYAEGVHYIENPEFVGVWVDGEDKILFGIQPNGNFFFGCGVPSQIIEYVNQKIKETPVDEIFTFLVGLMTDNLTLKEYLDSTYGRYLENSEWVKVLLDSEKKVLSGIQPNGNFFFGNNVRINGDLEVGNINGFSLHDFNDNIDNIEDNIEELQEEISELAIKPLKFLIIGDSYSQDGGNWVLPMMSYFPEGSSWISLAVGSASLKDHYSDREEYPYSDRPVRTDNIGNHNTFACQILKLKRLMAGVDLDAGEIQIYRNPEEYPDIIIIEGGQNDNPDTDNKVETYKDQFSKYLTNVYVRPAYGNTPELGSVYVKTPLDEIDRTCFAGAYRYLCDELTFLFPNAQIFFTTRSGLGYWSSNVPDISNRIAIQQRLCADYCGVPIIDWHRDAQISVINNYPDGDGSYEHPYTKGVGVHGEDSHDSMHPNNRGGNKYGSLAALTIKQKYINF